MTMGNNVISEDVLLVTCLETVCRIKNLTVPKCYHTISVKKIKDVKVPIRAKEMLRFAQLHAIFVRLALPHPPQIDQEFPVSPDGVRLVIFQDIVDLMSILIAELFYRLSIAVH